VPQMLMLCSHDSRPLPFYILSLHDALPICVVRLAILAHRAPEILELEVLESLELLVGHARPVPLEHFVERGVRLPVREDLAGNRSEEHTSELQSRENLVCRLLLEKKKLAWM